MAHLNVEIKAHCESQDEIRKILNAHRADFKGVDHQIDTYFNVSFGRLKLREGNIENHLIHYERENKEGPKQSNVILFKSDPRSALKEILTKALGVLIIVDKEREIYFIGNVKFHLDRVQNLGTFVEIEAIDKDGTMTKEKLQEQCENYVSLLGIESAEMIAGSYSDLLLAQAESKQ